MQVIAASWPDLKSPKEGLKASKIVAFTTTRLAGHSTAEYQSFNMGLHVGDDPVVVQQNRNALLRACKLESAQWLEQVHGTLCVKALANNKVEVADACWTDEENLACVVMTADCLPVAFRQGNKIAVAHAGWRGLVAGVLENTLSHFDLATTDVWLGPAIGAHAFEVGDEVRTQFIADNSEASAAFIAAGAPGKWLADIYQLARIKLLAAGLGSPRIYGGEHCTFSESEQFYSYRRTASTGRMATVIYRTAAN